VTPDRSTVKRSPTTGGSSPVTAGRPVGSWFGTGPVMVRDTVSPPLHSSPEATPSQATREASVVMLVSESLKA